MEVNWPALCGLLGALIVMLALLCLAFMFALNQVSAEKRALESQLKLDPYVQRALDRT